MWPQSNAEWVASVRARDPPTDTCRPAPRAPNDDITGCSARRCSLPIRSHRSSRAAGPNLAAPVRGPDPGTTVPPGVAKRSRASLAWRAHVGPGAVSPAPSHGTAAKAFSLNQKPDPFDTLALIIRRQTGSGIDGVACRRYSAVAVDLSVGPIVLELPPGPPMGTANDLNQLWLSAGLQGRPARTCRSAIYIGRVREVLEDG